MAPTVKISEVLGVRDRVALVGGTAAVHRAGPAVSYVLCDVSRPLP